MQVQINKEFKGRKMHTDIYTGSDQKTLRPVVNILNKEINSITIINRIQQII